MTRSTNQRLFIFFLLCWTAAALGALPFSAAKAGQKIAEITVEKQSPGYTWILRTPGKSGVAQISLELRDAAGNPVKQRLVTGDVWMPRMPMQGYPLELTFEEAEGGRYHALVQYGHGGHWQIRAMFRDDRRQEFQESFDVDIAD